MDRIKIAGARQHNLKNVDLELPRDRLVVLTGPSGSGKSTLAFDTIYAEGQRRYVESLSAYARQFLEQLAKPDVDSIEGLSPSIAIEQRPLAKSPRSTVATVTEIADYLRLLYARVGSVFCPSCDRPVEAQTVQNMVDRILGLGDGARATLLAPIARKSTEVVLLVEQLRRDGFVRARLDGEVVDLGDELPLGRGRHDLDVVVDRIKVGPSAKSRITDSVELALKLGDGRLLLDPSTRDEAVEPIWMSERFACVDCGITLPPIEPRLFSFNSPHGACPACDGIGQRREIDRASLVDEKLSLRKGAILPWGRPGSLSYATELDRLVKVLGVDPDVPFKSLRKEARAAIIDGASDGAKPKRGSKRLPFEGIVTRLERALGLGGPDEPNDETDDADDADEIDDFADPHRFVVTRVCEACRGERLRPEALAVRVAGRTIAEITKMPLLRVKAQLDALMADRAGIAEAQWAVAAPLLTAICARLGFLIDVGLGYLSLGRPAQTLSGGEGQRIRLATQIGAALVGVLYVLDEPSVGLHPRDNDRLLEALRRLVDLGNSVIVVEHDKDAIGAADHVVELGPGAGIHGGRIVAQGSPAELMVDPQSRTGAYLAGRVSGPTLKRKARPRSKGIVIRGATAHNLAGVTAEFPLGLVTAVTGVSGSGKSSLIMDTLLPAARARLYRAKGPIGECEAITGLDKIDKVVAIDQAPIGRTPRSTPATYTGTFALLRELYASLPEARARGYKAGRFSFNVKGGRCEVCQGEGQLRVEMHFLPDIFVRCEACGGRRYNRETLEIDYRGCNIADALDLTVEEALERFDAIPGIRDRLSALTRVGLGYLTLGQSATTLSGGEAQRVKLARELSRKATGKTLYVMDEPTTGLAFSDVELLMEAIRALRDAGNTLVIIEHNLDVIRAADWIIDLGPDGGDGGGQIVAEGSVEDVAKSPRSRTGIYLRREKSSTTGAKRAEKGPSARSRGKEARTPR